jgi:hypothetical protein
VPASPNKSEILVRLEHLKAPVVTELKTSPDGSTDGVTCRIMEESEHHVVLFHELERSWRVAELLIGPPMFTIAVYWQLRPYNMYAWFKADGGFVAAYFNAVHLPGDVRTAGAVSYYDQVLDVLWRLGSAPVVLDEDELYLLPEKDVRQARETVTWLQPRAQYIAVSTVRSLFVEWA